MALATSDGGRGKTKPTDPSSSAYYNRTGYGLPPAAGYEQKTGSTSNWGAGDSSKRAGSRGPQSVGNLGRTAVTGANVGAETGLDVINSNNKPSYTPSYSGGGGGYSAPVYEQPDYSAWFNALAEMNNQKYNALRDAIAQQRQRADEMNNMNYARNLREWRKMYADRRNGQGLTNRLGISYARDNNSRLINDAFNENNLNALSGRYTDMANLTSFLPNMDNDTIKKIMSNVGSWKI